jgi:hypothetical protein
MSPRECEDCGDFMSLNHRGELHCQQCARYEERDEDDSDDYEE